MDGRIQGEYFGKSGALFGLFIKTSLLTLLTLGLYRFWAKTRIRKYIWSATSGDGDSFEYTGTGLEKFLGFLIAVVFLAVYLGLVQVALAFFGVFLFREPESEAAFVTQTIGAYASLLAVVPLIFFAQYRARRYRMARTRWRGLRFGMDSAAGGYVWRAIGHTLLTIVTFGLLFPRQTFYLEKYMADRTWYGNGRFEQTGRWLSLYAGLKHVLLGVVILVGIPALGAVLQSPWLMLIGALVGYVWVLVGFVYYRVFVVNYMASHKVYDGAILFQSEARLGDVLRILIIGGLVIFAVGLFGGGILSGALALIVPMGDLLGGTIDPTTGNSGMLLGAVLAAGVPYLTLLLVLSGLSLVLITQKILAHVVTHITIHNSDHLDTVRQRAADKGADAEGFADALDVGSAF